MNLKDKAVLVQLNVGCWSARKYDKKASDKVEHDNQAKHGVARVNKALVAKEAIGDVQKKFMDIRWFFYEQTRPWMTGIGILKNEAYEDFSKGLQERIMEAEKAVDEFLPLYPGLYEQAKEDLGKMFNASDYPDVSSIRDKFYIKVKFMPVPDTDFRAAGFNETDQEEIRKNIEQSIKDGIGETLKQTYLEFGGFISNMVTRLDDFGKKNGKNHTFRDSLVGNIQSMVDRLPKLNINDDPALYALGKEIEEKLCKFSGDELRQDKKLRNHVKKEAEAIYQKMEGYFN